MNDLMEADTIEIQTKWHRPVPYQLCTKEIAEKIFEYDFDLRDEGFRKYAEDRGVFQICNTTLEIDVRFYMTMSDYEILNHPYSKASIMGIEFSEEQKKINLHIIKITKGKLQDCWEVYKLYEVF